MFVDEKLLVCFNVILIFQITFLVQTTGTSTTPLDLIPLTFPDHNGTHPILFRNSEAVSKPPDIFPTNDSNYKIINNKTILDSLQKHIAKNPNQTDTEVPDLTLPVPHPEAALEQPLVILKNHEKNKNDKKDVLYMVTSRLPSKDPQFDAELIEDDVKKTEDVKLNSTSRRSQDHRDHGHTNRAGTLPVQGQLAGIIAGVFTLVAFIAYIGLLAWRRYLERRYGTRELLIDEDDYVVHNEITNFQL